jgi:acyl-CoA dehydrogenase
MRLIGSAERGLQLAKARGLGRVAFGRPIAEAGGFRESLARHRTALDAARLLVLHASAALDTAGGDARSAAAEIAMAKLAAPAAAIACLDWAVQVHGGAGVSGDTPLAYLWAGARTLRLADGPDEVHLENLAKLELRRGVAKL